MRTYINTYIHTCGAKNTRLCLIHVQLTGHRLHLNVLLLQVLLVHRKLLCHFRTLHSYGDKLVWDMKAVVVWHTYVCMCIQKLYQYMVPKVSTQQLQL